MKRIVDQVRAKQQQANKQPNEKSEHSPNLTQSPSPSIAAAAAELHQRTRSPQTTPSPSSDSSTSDASKTTPSRSSTPAAASTVPAAAAVDTSKTKMKFAVVSDLIRLTQRFAGVAKHVIGAKKDSDDEEDGESDDSLPESGTGPLSPSKRSPSKRKRFATGVVENQVELAHRPGTIWNCIRLADLQEFDRLIAAEGEAIMWKRDTLYAMPLHMCFVYNSPAHMVLAEKIMNRFPELVSCQYEGTEYRGENILHIAIVNQQVEVVEALIQRNKELLKQQADGNFFKIGSACYYGEFPLFFAACTNQKRMVELLLAGGADLNDEDSNGNTILHLCVLHSSPTMYAFLKSEWKARYEGRPNAPPALWTRTNLDRHSPLTLAARMGNAEMFGFLLEEERRVQWSYGPVSCVLVPLEGVDVPLAMDFAAPSVVYSNHGPAADATSNDPTSPTAASTPLIHKHRAPSVLGRGDGALELIVQYAHLDLLMHPRVLELIDKKWDKFARKIFYRRFVFSLIYLTIFTLTTIMRMTSHPLETAALAHHKAVANSADSESSSSAAGSAPIVYDPIGMFENFGTFLYDLLASPSDWSETCSSYPVWQYVGELIVVWGAIYKGAWEIREMRKFGLQTYLHATGSALLENIFSLSFCVCILLVLLLTLFNSPMERAVLAIASIMCWAYQFYFLLAFRLTGPMIVMIYQMLTNDVMRFLCIYGVFLMGYSLAFFVLFDYEGINGFVQAFEGCFLATLGDFDLEAYASLHYWWLSLTLLIVFVVVVTILLLNLLIAMMGDTYSQVDSTAEKQWHLERARIIFDIEHEMTQTERELDEHKYWVTVEGKRFLQVHVVNKEHFHRKTSVPKPPQQPPSLPPPMKPEDQQLVDSFNALIKDGTIGITETKMD